MNIDEPMTLREICGQDIRYVNVWRNDIDVTRTLGAPFRYVNVETDTDWFSGYLRNRSTQVRLMICLNDIPVGMVNLLGIDWVARSGEFSIQIGDKAARGRGVGTWATERMLQHAFENMNLNRVALTVLSDNKAALQLYAKAGFKREGVLRRAAYKYGAYADLILMSVLRDEWPGSGRADTGGTA